jgi:hypothetical protein
MDKFAAIEAARTSRDPRDLTAAASSPRPSAPFAFKGAVVHRHEGRKRLVSSDGLRFEYEGTPSAQRHRGKLSPMGSVDSLGRRVGVGAGGGPGRGVAGMSPERRREQSRRANAARWSK